MLQLKNTQKTYSEHIQFLLKEAVTNYKIADQLFAVANKATTHELKVVELNKAEEKILSALEQQNQVIELLKKSANGIASKS